MWMWVWLLGVAWSSSVDIDAIKSSLTQGEVIDRDGVSAKSGELPDYLDQAGLAYKTKCRVWLRLDDGQGVQVIHEDCPEDLWFAIDESLLNSVWQKTNTPQLTGLLPLNLTHDHQADAPQFFLSFFVHG